MKTEQKTAYLYKWHPDKETNMTTSSATPLDPFQLLFQQVMIITLTSATIQISFYSVSKFQRQKLYETEISLYNKIMYCVIYNP